MDNMIIDFTTKDYNKSDYVFWLNILKRKSYKVSKPKDKKII